MLHPKEAAVQLEDEMFNRRAKPIGIIGVPDNQRPDEWSCNVQGASVRCTQLVGPSRLLHS